MESMQIVKKIAKWFIPVAVKEIVDDIRKQRAEQEAVKEEEDAVTRMFEENQMFINRYDGQRCFILGTGPSINTQDLTPLSNEKCFALNLFYHHKDYKTINPLFNVFSGLFVHPHISREKGLSQLQEMNEKIPHDSYLFTNYLDQPFIQENRLFLKHRLHYFLMEENLDDIFEKDLNLTRPIYRSQNVSLIAIQLAVGMGFKEIYLIGVDHDWLLSFAQRSSAHFYKSEESVLEKDRNDPWEAWDWEFFFRSHLAMWQQYKIIKSWADTKGVSIYNATKGGILDVFPRVDFETLCQG